MGDELRVLEKDVGTWDAAVEVRPGPGAEVQRSTGVAENRLICGGRWLVSEFRGSAGFDGHGVYGWDAGRGCYTGTWVDPMRTFLAVGEGRWDAASQTMTFRYSRDDFKWRETTESVDPDTRIFRTFMTLPDGSELETITTTYKRRR